MRCLKRYITWVYAYLLDHPLTVHKGHRSGIGGRDGEMTDQERISRGRHCPQRQERLCWRSSNPFHQSRLIGVVPVR